MPTFTPIKKGITTIKWGSGGIITAGGTGLTTAIVESVKLRPLNKRAEIEDNDGFTAATVTIPDGYEGTVDCVYQSNITWPAVGDVIQLKGPRDSTAKKYEVTEVEDTAQRKKEATLSIKCVNYNKITLP